MIRPRKGSRERAELLAALRRRGRRRGRSREQRSIIAEHTAFADHSQTARSTGRLLPLLGSARWSRSSSRSDAGRRRRGAAPRARGRGRAAGAVVASAGDPALVTYFRSSAKPIQALPLVRRAADLDDEEIAIACASHLAASRAARGRAQPARQGARRRGRPRVRTVEPTRADADRAQLLGEARGDARALPRARLAERGLPAARAPVPAGACWPRSQRPRRSMRRRCRRRSTAAASSRSRFRSSGWRTCSRGSSSSRAERRDALRCARTRS